MTEFYVLRYVPDVEVRQRKHVHTLGRFPSWVDAEDARLVSPVAVLLEVVGPRQERAS